MSRPVGPRSLPILLTLVGVPVAVFGRRNKDEWLGELESMRDDASGPGSEVGAVTGPTSDADDLTASASRAEGVDESPAPAQATPLDQAMIDLTDASTPGSRRAPRPAPNRERPSELWHAPIEIGVAGMSPELASEERVVPAELVGPAPAGGDGGTALFDLTPPASSSGQPVDLPADPHVDVVSARDLLDDPSGEDPTDRSVVAKGRLRPPIDIFDVAQPVAPEAEPLTPTALEPSSPAHGDGDQTGPESETSKLVDGPVGRRPSRAVASRSLFGGGAPLPAAQRPEEELVELSDAGELVDHRGTIRVSERVRPEIVRSASDDSLTLDSGWCWIFRANAVPPARVSLTQGTLVVPGTTRVLAVVEADGSTFVSVVAGTAHLEHSSGLVPLPTGSIAHLGDDGALTVDSASAEEMAADALLTRNLQMDDALDAITGLQRLTSGQ